MDIGLIGINKYAKFLNFACDLHIYAFQQFLKQNGHDSTILDYKPAYYGNFDMRHPAHGAEAQYRRAVMKKMDEGSLRKYAELAVGYRSAEVERERRYEKFESFAARHLTFTEEVYDSDLLEVEDPGFDCYICVTDVIWQSIPRHDFDRGFLLGSKAFEGKQKIAYAASRGASEDFAEEQERIFREYMEDIDAISVREQDFSDYVEKLSGKPVATVLDPVMFHDGDFWAQIAEKPDLDRYIVLYYVMENSADTIAKAVEYAKLHDLTIVEVSDRPLKHGKITDPDVKHIARYDVGMEEWLGYIQHAESVFTNSFHGCCFSLLFEKKLFVGKRNGQKVPNFLATFELSDRRFASDVDPGDLPGDIDYAPVREILREKREESAAFILGALADAEKRAASGVVGGHRKHDERRRAIEYSVHFHSGRMGADDGTSVAMRKSPQAEGATIKRFKSGAVEYHWPNARSRNDGSARIGDALFSAKGHRLVGWTMRFRIDNRWFWHLEDGALAPGSTGGEEIEGKKVFAAGATIPHLPVNQVRTAVFVAQWEEGATAEDEASPGSASPASPLRGLLGRLRRTTKG